MSPWSSSLMTCSCCSCMWAGLPACGCDGLLRAARAWDTRPCQAGPARAILEHRGTRKGQALGAPASWVYGPFVDEWLPAYVAGTIRWAIEATWFRRAIDRVCVRALSVALFFCCFVSPCTIAVPHGRASPSTRKVHILWFELEFCSYEPPRRVVSCCASAYSSNSYRI